MGQSFYWETNSNLSMQEIHVYETSQKFNTVSTKALKPEDL
jgi:hypothetical protein